MDTTMTTQIITAMADDARRLSMVLDRLAMEMATRNDLSLASDAITAVKTFIGNARLDLLVTRPLREYRQEVDDLQKKIDSDSTSSDL